MIEISHISTDEMTVNDLTKMLLLNKFKEFIELVEILKIETDSDDEASDSEFNDDEASDNVKNDGNFVANYYEEAGEEAGKKADKEVSFEAEKAE